MTMPRFSKKVERKLKPYLANPDKNIYAEFRYSGSSQRVRFGRLVGNRLLTIDESTSIGYLFSAEEWMEPLHFEGKPHVGVDPVIHELGIRNLLEMNAHRPKPTKRLKGIIETMSRKRVKENPLENEVDKLHRENARLTRQLNRALGVAVDVDALGLTGGKIPPTNFEALVKTPILFDFAAIYTVKAPDGKPALMMDLLETNYSKNRKKPAYTPTQKDAKWCYSENRVGGRLLEFIDSTPAGSPYLGPPQWEITDKFGFDPLSKRKK